MKKITSIILSVLLVLSFLPSVSLVGLAADEAPRNNGIQMEDNSAQTVFKTENYTMEIEKTGFRYGFYKPDGTTIMDKHEISGIRFAPAGEEPKDVSTTELLGFSGDSASFNVVNSGGEKAEIKVIFYPRYVNIKIKPDGSKTFKTMAKESIAKTHLPRKAKTPLGISETTAPLGGSGIENENSARKGFAKRSGIQLFNSDSSYLELDSTGKIDAAVRQVNAGNLGDKYSISTDIKLNTGSTRSAGIFGQYGLPNDFLLFFIRAGAKPMLKHISPDSSKETDFTSKNLIPSIVIAENTWYNLKMEIDGKDIKCWIDDQLIYDVTNTAVSASQISGGCGIRVDKTVASIDNLMVEKDGTEVLFEDFEDTSKINTWQKNLWAIVMGEDKAVHIGDDGTRTLVPVYDDSLNRFLHITPSSLDNVSVRKLEQNIPDDYVFEARVRFENRVPSASSTGIFAHFQEFNKIKLFFLKDQLASLKRLGASTITLGEESYSEIKANTWYRCKLIVEGKNTKAYIGDTLIFEGEDTTATAQQLVGAPGFRVYKDSASFDDVKIYNPNDANDIYYENDFEDYTLEQVKADFSEQADHLGGTDNAKLVLKTEVADDHPDGVIDDAVEEKYLYINANPVTNALIKGGESYDDYSFSGELEFANNDETTALYIGGRMQDKENGYLFGFDFSGTKRAVLYKLENNIKTEITSTYFDYLFDNIYNMEINFAGNSIDCKVDGTTVISASDSTFTQGTAGVRAETTIAKVHSVKLGDSFADDFTADLSGWDITGEGFISYDGDPAQMGEAPDLAKRFVIDARLAGGVDYMFGLGDYGATTNDGYGVRETSNVVGVNRMTAGKFTNIEGGAIRFMSNFSIAPQLGFAQVLFEEADKRVAITDEHTLLGALQTKEVDGLYYFFGTMEEIYGDYKKVRNEAGYIDTKPHYEMYGLGWEAFGALGWNAYQSSVVNTIQEYLDAGYNITWAVIGSGFWKGDRSGVEGTTTSFGIWDDEADPEGRKDGLPNPRFPDPQGMRDFFVSNNIKQLLGLRVHLKLPEEMGGKRDVKVDGTFADDLIANEYYLKDYDGELMKISAKYPTGGVNRGATAYVDGSNPDAAEWYRQQAALWNVDGYKEDTMVINQRTFNDGNCNRLMAHMIEQDDSVVIMRNGAYSLSGDVLRINDANFGTSNGAFNNSPDRMIINMAAYAASGISNVYPDIIGGTGGDISNTTYQKYVVRNAQMAALCPSVSLGINVLKMSNDDYKNAAFNAINWHSTYAPYIYDAALKSWETGYPLSHTPLYLAYPEDSNTYEMITSQNRQYQWLVGESLLAAPLFGTDFHQTDYRDVYLPEGKWIEYSTGETFEVGSEGLTLPDRYHPIDEIPAFVGGKGVLIGEDMENKGSYFAEVFPIATGGSTYNYTHIDGITTSQIVNNNAGWSPDSLVITDTTTGAKVDYTINPINKAIKFDYTAGHDYELTGGEPTGAIAFVGIKEESDNLDIIVNQTAKLKVDKVTLDTGIEENKDNLNIEFISEDNSVLTVDNSGNVKGKSAGVTSVYARVSQKSAPTNRWVNSNKLQFTVKDAKVDITSVAGMDYTEDFADESLSNWQEINTAGNFSVKNADGENYLHYDGHHLRGSLMQGTTDWDDYSIETELSFPELVGGKTVGFNVRYNGYNETYLVAYSHGTGIRILKRDDSTQELAKKAVTLNENTKYKLRAEVKGNTISAYLDDQLMVTAVDNRWSAGTAGLYASGMKADFDYISINSPITQLPATISGTSLGVDTIRVLIGEYVYTAQPDGTGNWLISADTLNKGSNHVVLQGLNAKGEVVSSHEQTMLVTADTAAPEAAKLESISVASLPNKLDYLKGESLDLTGLVVEGNYDDGSKKDVTDYAAVSGFDSDIIGTQTVTLTFNGKTTSFDIIISAPVTPEPVLTEIAVISLPDKIDYIKGESFNPIGLKVVARYDDTSEKDITSAISLSGFDSSAVGGQIITVSFKGKTAVFSITIKEKPVDPIEPVPVTLTKIEISKLPNKVAYTQNESFDSRGIQVTAHYSDGTTKDVSDKTTFSGYDMAHVGSQTVTVMFSGKTASFTVTVAEKQVSSDGKGTPDYGGNTSSGSDKLDTDSVPKSAKEQKAKDPVSEEQPHLSPQTPETKDDVEVKENSATKAPTAEVQDTETAKEETTDSKDDVSKSDDIPEETKPEKEEKPKENSKTEEKQTESSTADSTPEKPSETVKKSNTGIIVSGIVVAAIVVGLGVFIKLGKKD